ncbi:MAG: 6,7-dimethyl-8-ribityllumazine synthase [Gammaproteobacteria bacterium]|jgi:6,7-dimethyl-8-ribityllumazine synthase|nr:6,7-dimethyl-8-ribityllumazine synthase [Gammaproteobacteria bacterium]
MQILDVQNPQVCFNVAIVISRFNRDITQKLYEGAIQRLEELDFNTQQVTLVWVPGAIEIPITAQRLAQTNKFEAIICLGAVIRGETKHFDYVCQQVSQGCQQVSLTQNIPLIFGILTVENEEQALDRVGGKHGHLGCSAIDSAIELISVLRQI